MTLLYSTIVYLIYFLLLKCHRPQTKVVCPQNCVLLCVPVTLPSGRRRISWWLLCLIIEVSRCFIYRVKNKVTWCVGIQNVYLCTEYNIELLKYILYFCIGLWLEINSDFTIKASFCTRCVLWLVVLLL